MGERQQEIEAVTPVVMALPTMRALRLGGDDLAAPYLVEQTKEVMP